MDVSPQEEHFTRQVVVGAKWPESSELPVTFADQILISFRGDVFIMTIGQTDPPLVHPSDQEGLARIVRDGQVPIRPLVRLAVSQANMEEWASVISEFVTQFKVTES